MSINNRWFQLCASLVAMIMIANLQYAWTLFVQPMQAATGWKLSDVQFAFTLFILCQTWVQPLDGWLIDRLGPRGFISVAGILCGLGWAGMGYATSLRTGPKANDIDRNPEVSLAYVSNPTLPAYAECRGGLLERILSGEPHYRAVVAPRPSAGWDNE